MSSAFCTLTDHPAPGGGVDYIEMDPGCPSGPSLIPYLEDYTVRQGDDAFIDVKIGN